MSIFFALGFVICLMVILIVYFAIQYKEEKIKCNIYSELVQIQNTQIHAQEEIIKDFKKLCVLYRERIDLYEHLMKLYEEREK